MPPQAARTKRALVAGASGLVGRECLAALLASYRYAEVVALVRRPLPQRDPRLKQLQVDFDGLDNALESLIMDDVFCCLGTTMRRAGSREAFWRVDYELPLRLANTTRNRGATRFVLVSSLGANRRARTFYLRVKGELETALTALDFPTLIVVRPSLLLGNRPESRPGEAAAALVMRAISPILVGRFRKLRPVPARTVALAMVAAANTDDGSRVVVESDELAKRARTYGGAS